MFRLEHSLEQVCWCSRLVLVAQCGGAGAPGQVPAVLLQTHRNEFLPRLWLVLLVLWGWSLLSPVGLGKAGALHTKPVGAALSHQQFRITCWPYYSPPVWLAKAL